jgi:phasin family protein
LIATRPTQQEPDMPTRTAAPKKTAAKAAGKKTPARKAPPRAVASPPAALDEASLQDLLARLSRLELAGLAGRLVDGWRKDLQALVTASQRSYAGLQEVVARQTAQIKEAAGELRSVGMAMGVAGTTESVRRIDDLAVGALQLALNDIRELSDMTAKSQREAYELVQRRVAENLDEVQRALRRK